MTLDSVCLTASMKVSSSEIESLRKAGCVHELNGMFNSKVEEQLYLKLDSNKKFLNMMTPINHIYLFRSIINYHNSNKNSNFLKSLRQKKNTFSSYFRYERVLTIGNIPNLLFVNQSTFHYLRHTRR